MPGISTLPKNNPAERAFCANGWRADPDFQTPNLELLAKQGARFDRLYAVCPAGGPSRAALITGRYPYASGVTRDDVRLPVDQPSIAEQLKGAGYETGFIGQWLLDGAEEPGFVPPGPRRHGFQYWAAFNRGYHYFDSVYFRDKPEPIHAEGFEPVLSFCPQAIDFIKQKRQNPFCLFLAWGPPHPPRTPPSSYHALCSALDTNAGRLMRALDEQHLTEDTIVVFTSDCGDMLGSHGLEGANVPFEESVRVPLVVRYPREINAGRTYDFPLSNADLMPSVLGLCGASHSG